MEPQLVSAILIFLASIIALIVGKKKLDKETLKIDKETDSISVITSNQALESVILLLSPLKEEVKELHGEVVLLRKANTDLTFEVSALQQENKKLLEENRKLGVSITKLRLLIQQAANGIRLFNLVEYSSDGILIEDPNRKVSMVNSTFCAMFDIPVKPEDMIGLDCTQAAYNLTSVDDIDAFVLNVDKLIEEWNPVTDEPIRLADGTILYRSFIPLDHLDGTREIAWIYKLNCN